MCYVYQRGRASSCEMSLVSESCLKTSRCCHISNELSFVWFFGIYHVAAGIITKQPLTLTNIFDKKPNLIGITEMILCYVVTKFS